MPIKLFNLAEKEGIIIEWWDFEPPLEAVYWYTPGIPPIIGLTNSLYSASRAYFRCVLAEELGHHFTTVGKTIPRTFFHYRNRLEVSRSEYRAMRWAANWLMPRDSLISVLKNGIVNVWDIADFFDVTEDMVRFRMSLPDIYTIYATCGTNKRKKVTL